MTVNKLQLPAKQNAVQQKINEIIDNLGGGGANTDLSNLTATGEAHFLKNTATGTNSLTIGGTATSVNAAVNIGYNSSVALSAGGQATRGIAIGVGANVTGTDSIQLGMGTASSNSSLYAGFYIYGNYQLLDGTTGLIPDARISANIQRTATAVTHPASTAIGGVDVPVFVNSNGVVTSTGKSIASSRFDGQWVQSFTTLMESSGTKNGVQISLSSYLPSDSYKYNVKFKLYGYNKENIYSYFINTDIFNNGSTTTSVEYIYSQMYGGPYSRQNVSIFDLPVGTGRYIKLYGSGGSEIRVFALGYRRIGTNT